jgi:delta-aminolevulinic acid dehydratase/porphobilinogen synthase
MNNMVSFLRHRRYRSSLNRRKLFGGEKLHRSDLILPVLDEKDKDSQGSVSLSPKNSLFKATRILKEIYPGLRGFCDVALDLTQAMVMMDVWMKKVLLIMIKT